MERGVIGADEAVVVFENMRVVELETKLNDFQHKSCSYPSLRLRLRLAMTLKNHSI